jgi:hypothetical protein
MTVAFSCRPSRALTKLIAAALLDLQLREKLFADREATAREFDVPPEEFDALKNLDREKFERSAARLRGC